MRMMGVRGGLPPKGRSETPVQPPQRQADAGGQPQVCSLQIGFFNFSTNSLLFFTIDLAVYELTKYEARKRFFKAILIYHAFFSDF